MSEISDLFWELADQLMAEDDRVVEGTVMNSRCLRVGDEFLAMCALEGAGLVVKLPETRVDAIIASGRGQPFSPTGKTFREWISIPEPDRKLWLTLLREGIEFVAA